MITFGYHHIWGCSPCLSFMLSCLLLGSSELITYKHNCMIFGYCGTLLTLFISLLDAYCVHDNLISSNNYDSNKNNSSLFLAMSFCSISFINMTFFNMTSQDQKGPFWIVYEALQPGLKDSWPKAGSQVSVVFLSSSKMFVTFFDAFDSFTTYCTFKSEFPLTYFKLLFGRILRVMPSSTLLELRMPRTLQCPRK